MVFTALWWIFPDIYVYTDVIVMVNVSIAVFNLLPVYPLDGGRILMALLKIKFGAKRAFKVVRNLGIICCIAFLALYFYSLTFEVNYTFAVIAVFMLSSILESSTGEDMERIIYPPSQKFLIRGVEKKFIQVSGELTILKLIKLLGTDYYYVIEIVGEKGNKLLTIEHRELENILLKNSPNTLLKDIER